MRLVCAYHIPPFYLIICNAVLSAVTHIIILVLTTSQCVPVHALGAELRQYSFSPLSPQPIYTHELTSDLMTEVNNKKGHGMVVQDKIIINVVSNLN